MNVAQLLQRVTACGYRVSLTADGPRLLPARSECIMPGPLLKAMKQFRAEVVAYLSTCRLCGRDVSDDETRARLADQLFCDRGYAKAVVDGMGRHHEASEQCPFRT